MYHVLDHFKQPPWRNYRKYIFVRGKKSWNEKHCLSIHIFAVRYDMKYNLRGVEARFPSIILRPREDMNHHISNVHSKNNNNNLSLQNHQSGSHSSSSISSHALSTATGTTNPHNNDTSDLHQDTFELWGLTLRTCSALLQVIDHPPLDIPPLKYREGAQGGFYRKI